MNVNLHETRPKATLRLTATALGAATFLLLGGCSSLDGLFGGDKVDYRSQAAKTAPLEVPPDLTQLARDGRFRPQGGVVSASATGATGAPGTAAAAPAVAAVAPAAVGEIRVERQGQQRWLVVPMTPEALWPQLRAFWQERGFNIEVENAQTGVMETAWAENRAKIPQGTIRNLIGKVFDSAYSSGERDRFRTRVERTASGSEIFISHRGMEEIYLSAQKDNTAWRGRPADPQLEAEFLSRLMVKLGTAEEPARQAVAKAAEQPARARPVVATGATSLEIDDGFDRAWRRVGLALDRSGFTVEDRDRAAGLYFVRYVDPASAGKEEPGFFSKFFGGDDKTGTPVKYRVLVKSQDSKTVVTVQNAQGAPDTGPIAKQIVALLAADLK